MTRMGGMKRSAEVLREYGPYPGINHVHGVTFDGRRVWFAAGEKLVAVDPATGKTVDSIVRRIAPVWGSIC